MKNRLLSHISIREGFTDRSDLKDYLEDCNFHTLSLIIKDLEKYIRKLTNTILNLENTLDYVKEFTYNEEDTYNN